MKKIYVVRGIGIWKWRLWASHDFEVTVLEETLAGWKSYYTRREMLCYRGFRRLTGIKLRPGEYTTVEVREGLS